ncbi:recombination-associated protein RdgC [Crenobacter sp. SG2305]|uniref:recombination-associated protein RdgC n=1 Tax=Crenobacter oryzisoli TaxID=3056844 RepID=UPI0025AB067F|nr:recombination-associated protein RdgC [Crenobacter sp. SG2305]MDN0082455.1 recombination-associated protein RdgC [Crenobacter sp. SG2305]
MSFPNACIFYVLDTSNHDLSTLDGALAKKPFTPCQGLDWNSSGWVAPMTQAESLVFTAQGAHKVLLRRQDKVLPGGVVADALEAKVTEIQDKELRKVGRKEKAALKEQIIDDLLPRAFTKKGETMAVLDPQAGMLWVDTTNRTQAETLIGELRDALPGLPTVLPRTMTPPLNAMTDWLLAGEVGDGFKLDDEALIQAQGEKAGSVRVSQMDLGADEIRQLLNTGKRVHKLGLTWRDRIAFVLSDDLSISKLKWLDVLQEEASQAGDDPASFAEATFRIVVQELRDMIGALVPLLGGYANGVAEPHQSPC